MKLSGPHDRRESGEPARQEADWLAWSLHLIFGFFMGGGAGAGLALQLADAGLIGMGNFLKTAFGIALLIAAAASHWGHDLWYQRSLADMPEPPRSPFSAAWSLLIGLVGVTMIALVFHASWSSRSAASHGLDVSTIPLLVIAAMLLGLNVYALRTDTLLGIDFYLFKHEAPFWFWFYFVAQGATAVGILIAVFG